MALYEHIFLARQDVSQQQVEELTASLTEILTANGGKVTKNEYWGLKGLSYRIRKNRKAHYSPDEHRRSVGRRGRNGTPDAHQ